MFAFVYFFCLSFCVAYVLLCMTKRANPLKLTIAAIFTALPILNVLFTISILTDFWNKHGEEWLANVRKR